MPAMIAKMAESSVKTIREWVELLCRVCLRQVDGLALLLLTLPVVICRNRHGIRML
jgi:hypothetical protein